MAVVFSNNATTVLSSNITNSATSIAVQDGSVFPTLSGTDYFYATLQDPGNTKREIVKVTARSGNTLTVTRAVDGSSASAFSANDAFELRLNAAALNDAVNSGTADLELNSFTGDGSEVDFTLSMEALEANTLVYIDGVYQNKTAYSISGYVLTFSAAPDNGAAIEVTTATVAPIQESTDFLLNQFTGDGSDTTFTLSSSPEENQTTVFISGVYQSKSNYSISGTTLTFSTAPPASSSIEVMVARTVVYGIGTPSNDTVSTAKIVDGAVTPAKLSLTYATETFVGTAVSNLVDSSPAALDTLNELAAALGDDPNFATTVTNSIALKAPLASPSFTGNLTMASGGSIVAGGANDLILNAGESGTPDIYLQSGSSTKVKIEGSNGNVGIGVSPSSEFHVKGDANTIARIEPNNNSGKATLLVSSTASGDGGIQYDASTNQAHLFSYSDMTFNVGTGNLSGGYPANERMRISGGNLLVGKIASNTATVGHELRTNGVVTHTSGAVPTLYLNRTTSDGDIAVFRKDNTTVGSIGTSTGGLYIADAGVGFRFDSGGTDDIIPCNATGGAADASINLGSSGARLKDLYITGLDVTYSTYNKISSYFSGSYTSGFKFSDMNGGIWYDAGADDLTVSAGHANSQLILESGGSPTATLTSGGDLSLATDGAELQLYYTEPRTFITNNGASATIKQIDNDVTNAFIDFASWTNTSLMRIMNTGEQSRQIFGGGHRYEIEIHRSAPAVSKDFTINSNTGSNNSFGVVLKIINSRYLGGLGHSTWIIQGDLPGGNQNAVYRSVNGTDAGGQSFSITNVGLSSSSVVFRITLNDSYSDLYIEATTFAYSSGTCTLSY